MTYRLPKQDSIKAIRHIYNLSWIICVSAYPVRELFVISVVRLSLFAKPNLVSAVGAIVFFSLDGNDQVLPFSSCIGDFAFL